VSKKKKFNFKKEALKESKKIMNEMEGFRSILGDEVVDGILESAEENREQIRQLPDEDDEE